MALKTLYDLFSCILFAGIAVVFLQRSAAPARDATPLWRYSVAVLGCALGDVVGNAGYRIAGGALLFAAAAFSLLALDLLPSRPKT